MSLSGRIALSVLLQSKITASLGNEGYELNQSFALEIAEGVGAHQAQIVYAALRSLVRGTSEVLDLYASGSLLDVHGRALTMTNLKYLVVKNLSTAVDLLVAGGTTPVGLFANASDIARVKPGALFLWTAPNVDGLLITTNKNLKFEFEGTVTTDTYDVIAIGLD